MWIHDETIEMILMCQDWIWSARKETFKTNDALKLQNYLAITHAIEMIQVIRFR